ncbi:hypothetical protein [Flavobacterium sp.]|jgi:hypothetical protein|uniref:hypothetical protein n=1 Tax=Flavobacterium sp. TaxID=239 RepID=UPI00374CB525
MKKTDLLIGAIIGFVTTFLGVYLYLKFYVHYDFSNGLDDIRNQGILGKVITIGAILNLLTFFILLKLNKELMARGVVLATILLAVITMFV